MIAFVENEMWQSFLDQLSKSNVNVEIANISKMFSKQVQNISLRKKIDKNQNQKENMNIISLTKSKQKNQSYLWL